MALPVFSCVQLKKKSYNFLRKVILFHNAPLKQRTSRLSRAFKKFLRNEFARARARKSRLEFHRGRGYGFPVTMHGTGADLATAQSPRNRNFSRVDWIASIGLRWMHGTSIIEAGYMRALPRSTRAA